MLKEAWFSQYKGEKTVSMDRVILDGSLLKQGINYKHTLCPELECSSAESIYLHIRHPVGPSGSLMRRGGVSGDLIENADFLQTMPPVPWTLPSVFVMQGEPVKWELSNFYSPSEIALKRLKTIYGCYPLLYHWVPNLNTVGQKIEWLKKTSWHVGMHSALEAWKQERSARRQPAICAE